MSSQIPEVFAKAAYDYQAKLSGGDTVNGRDMKVSQAALQVFYSKRTKELERVLQARPLADICKANNIGMEGQQILSRELHRIAGRDQGR